MRTALLRAAVAPLLASALGVATLGVVTLGAAPAHAATPLAAPAVASLPVLSAAPAGDDAADPDRPVRIDVGRFEPRAVTPGATITVTGTLTNTGGSTITDLSVRLQRGQVLTTRDELAAAGRDPELDPATTVLPPFQDVPGELAPGGKLAFSYTIGSERLRLDRDGVYPVLLNINGAVDGDAQRRVGELPTFLVQQPVVPAARTAVAWLWPLVERTHRGPSGGFLDDGLNDAVRSGGRLDRALAVIERLPRSAVPGSPQGAPTLAVALAIDPALVEELRLMAAGPYAVDGVANAGRGTEAAAAFLERLAAVAAVHPVVSLPYGDVDADSLTTAGLSQVVLRSLPGSPEGTAQDRLPAGDQNGADATSAPAGAPGTAPPASAGEGDHAAGARILADALDVQPRTDLAWAADGYLRPDTLAILQSGGVDRVVVGSGGLTDGQKAVGLSGSTAAAHTTVTTAAGPVEALVADPALSSIVGSAEQSAGGARMAEQRYLAELAVLSLQAPAGSEQTVLVAPPRTVEAGPEGAGAMMADTAALPWLRPSSPDELFAAPAVAAGDLLPSGDAAALDAGGMADVVDSVAVREDLAGAVVGDAGTAFQTYDAAIARATSVAWRADPKGFRSGAEVLRSTMDGLRKRVTLLAPADGTYSLGSSDAPLVLTVRNDLPVAVRVLLEVQTRGAPSQAIADIGPQTLAPGQRTTLQVPTNLRQSGGFAVTAQLTTPSGRPLGDRIQLRVKSTGYGSISLLITIGAALLLGLLFLRRLVNFVLRRRRAAAATADEGVLEGAAVTRPTTRSPV
jgi:hypothetical protein